MVLDLIDPKTILIQHFVVLGILVTLVSISSSLSKEVRYKYIRKYFWTEKYFLIYLGYFLISFLISFRFYLDQNGTNANIINLLGLLLFYLLFVLTFVVSLIFLVKLDRDNFNKIINKKMKPPILKKEKKNEPLDDFYSNLLYISKNNLDIDCGEEEILKNAILYSIKNNNIDYIKPYYEKIIREEKDFGMFSKTFLSIMNKLKSNLFKKEPKESLSNLIIYQKLLSDFFAERFLEIKEFSRYLNSSGFYISNFFDIRVKKTFEENEDEEFIKNFKELGMRTIENLFLLNKNILKLKLENKLKLEYLSNQIPELNKYLENYNYIRETDLLSNYYEIIFKKEEDRTNEEKEKIKLVNIKLRIIKELKEELRKKQIKLFYLILSKTDKENLSRGFFNLAYKFFKIRGFRDKFNEHDDVDLIFDYDLDKIDFFGSNSGSSSGFNTFRYKLIIYFYEFLGDESSLKNNIGLLKKENFTISLTEIKKTIENLDINFVEKFFQLSEKDIKKLTEFKKQTISHFEKKKKENEAEEKKYIANASVDDKKQKQHKEKFERDCFEIWEKVQNNLKEIFEYKEVKNIPELKNYFGKYTLFPKMWLLESFYNTISLDRSAGRDFGNNQTNGKEKQILKEIEILLRNSKPKTLKNLEEISTILNDSGKEYYLIYGKKFEIYTIKGIDWKREGMQDGEIKIGNSLVHLIPNPNIDAKENFLFEKKAFTLEQNKKGFKDAKYPLHIEVRDLSKEEIKNILSKGKFKDELEVKQNAVIRITEQFKLRKNRDKFACKIKI